ncbi:hypothetical protein D3C78_1712350 [compost metagenome]
MDHVYLDGNPNNVLTGMQTVLLPASGGAVIEFTVKKEGDYPIVSHQLKDAQKGAMAILRVTKDGTDHKVDHTMGGELAYVRSGFKISRKSFDDPSRCSR